MCTLDKYFLKPWLFVYEAKSKFFFQGNFWIVYGGHLARFFKVDDFNFGFDDDILCGIHTEQNIDHLAVCC